MPRHDAPSGSDQLLNCNLERVVLRTAGAGGQVEVCKLLLRGSTVEAERELDLGRRVADLDVARHLAAGIDAPSGRPCIRTAYHAGEDLEALVAREGALTAAAACALLAPVARTLAAMHARRDPDLPHGLAHGDVKPGNLLRTGTTTLLLDFEHAGAAGTGRCAGTPGFAAPEAAAGMPLAAAFDVYGLGATLRFLLAGAQPRPGALAAQDPELQLLVAACTASAPAARPNAAAAAHRLDLIAQRLAADPAENARAALLAGDLEACQRTLDDGAVAAGPRELLGALLRRRQRLLARRPGLLGAATAPLPAGAPPPAVTARLHQLAGLLRVFPRNAAAAAARRAAKERAAALLPASLPRLADAVRAEEFGAARALLGNLNQMVRTALAAPGALRIAGEQDPRLPTLLQRAPLVHLHQESLRIAAASEESDRHTAAIEDAEGRLALGEAESIIDRIAMARGGTTGAVARRRDRLHRLGFYVERIGRAAGNLARLGELLPAADLRPVFAFVHECKDAASDAVPAEEPSGRAMGLRQMQLALANLADEFPALAPRVRPGLDSLRSALESVTDEAWELFAGAQQKLQSEPVPVRPLQNLLGRLDTCRLLEALIDRPQRARSQIIDRIESLRLRVEQAQAQRDRLTRGAELALARGHWTTGLFDMERAVTGLDDDAGDQEAARLRQRLAEARKRKQEIESAQRRNVELQSRYAALAADPECQPPERLQVLRERRDCLQFLAVHSQQERGRLYARDLRAVEQRIAVEQAGQADAAFAAAVGLDDRLLLARQTLAQFDALAEDESGQLPGEIQDLAAAWQHRLEEARTALAEHATRSAVRARRRQRAIMALAAIVLAGAFLAIGLLRGDPALAAADRLQNTDLAALTADGGALVERLRALAGSDRHAVRAVDLVAALGAATDFGAWQRDLAAELADDGVPVPFARQCWRIGIAQALRLADDAGRRSLRAAVAEVAPRLAARDIRLAPDAQALLDTPR